MGGRTRHERFRLECQKAYQEFQREREIYGLKITCIPEPPPQHKITNYAKPKSERKFRPIELPAIHTVDDKDGTPILTYFVGLTTREQAEAVADDLPGADVGDKEKEFIQQLLSYRLDGCWFYNGDKLEYITGDHWYMLNALKIDIVKKDRKGKPYRDIGHPKFIDAQRDVYLHLQQCVKNRMCYGQILISRRRFFKTTYATSVLLNSATLKRSAGHGIHAQNNDGAKGVFKKLVAMWRRLPKHPFFFPQHAGEDNPGTILEFRSERKRGRKNKYFTQDEVLESWIDFRSTKPQAYDGLPLEWCYIDEASKIEGCSLTELFSVVRECLVVGADIVGRMLVTSTAENIGGKTLEEFKKLWDESSLSTMDDSPLKMTSSGLYPLFIPADYGYTHDASDDGELPEEFRFATVDEWGYSDRDAARKLILAMRKTKSGNGLIRFIRKYPLTEAEAFTFGVSASPLPLEKIQEQKIFNYEYNLVCQESERPLKRGRLVWDTDTIMPSVKFIPDENGLFEFHPRILEEDLNQIIKGTRGYGPARKMIFTGVDPYDHKSTEEGEFSKAAAVAICKDPKYFMKPCVVAVYYGRPSDPKVMYEDVLKMCVFMSSTAYIENHKPGCVNHFIDRGFAGFVGIDPFNQKSTTPGISVRDEKKRSLMVDRLASYVSENVGHINTTQGKCYSEHYFEKWLEDLYNFDPDKWTKYDMTVATLLALMGLEKKHYVSPQFRDLTDYFPNLQEKKP